MQAYHHYLGWLGGNGGNGGGSDDSAFTLFKGVRLPHSYSQKAKALSPAGGIYTRRYEEQRGGAGAPWAGASSAAQRQAPTDADGDVVVIRRSGV